jgi:hypothetical protein
MDTEAKILAEVGRLQVDLSATKRVFEDARRAVNDGPPWPDAEAVKRVDAQNHAWAAKQNAFQVLRERTPKLAEELASLTRQSHK